MKRPPREQPAEPRFYRRSPETPIVLWICAAVCAHFIFGGGTEEVSKELRHASEDRRFISQLGTMARDRIRGADKTIDVSIIEEGKPAEEEPPAEEPKPPEPVAEKKPDPAKPEPPKPQEQKKAEPPKQQDVKVVVKEEDPVKKLDEIPLKEDQRIAVKQHADKNQEDNPNARFIADEANKVQEETVATQTAHDQDDPNPTPGTAKAGGPKDQTGDSDRTKIAESEEHKGDKDKAPGEKGTQFDVQKDNKPIDKPMAPVAVNQAPSAQVAPRTGGDGRAPSTAAQKEPAPQLAPGTPPGPSPEVVQGGASSGWAFNPVRPGVDGPNAPVPGVTNQNKPLVPQTPGKTKWLGLGGNPGPGQVNLNLTNSGVVAVVGADQLRKEREADGERRKSEHRGSWTASNFERWRNAIENYVSSVKPGNQTALNTAAVPFATYLNTIHNRIHPLFAESFLDSLDGLPKQHPMNDPKLNTRLEIVVSPKEGRIVKMGIVKTSGITAFDIAALDAVNRAQPFGPAPSAIISADGNVYLHWEFHRDSVFACSTMHARPFMLNTPGKPNQEEPQPPGQAPKPPQERGAPPVNLREMREGALPQEPRLARPAHG